MSIYSSSINVSLVYFLFFLYRNTPMDELFILDIRKAGLRAFIVNIILNSITIVYIVITENSNIRPENLTTIIRMFAVTYLITFLVFTLTLLYFQKSEKRSLKD